MIPVWDFGIRMVVAFQGLGDWLTLPMKFFSFLGTEDFFMFILPVLFWCVDMGLGLRVGFILMIGTCLNDALKIALHGPRPYWYDPQARALSAETSFGAPSGHAETAASVWGMLAARLRRGWAWVVAILLAVIIGLSRIYLGVHFPHDVLLGWLVGGMVLWLVLRFWDPAAAWLKKRTTGGQILSGFLFSLALFLPTLLAYALVQANWQLPQAWLDNVALALPDGPFPTPFSLEGPISNAGTIFGLAVGLAWLTRLGGFEMKAPFWKLFLRYLVGLIGVVILRYGLKAIFPEGGTLVAYLFRYLRYTLIGFWVTGLAPWAFLRLKLAAPVVK
ncbi:MAG: phosphatase PAP2 family protein [Anaerolineales bacterium]|nr:phosphatase PAP2 family protein [Anaerolineales bacterium]